MGGEIGEQLLSCGFLRHMLDFLRQSDILAGGDFQQIAIEGDGKGASLGGKAEEKNAAGRIGHYADRHG